MAHHVYPMVGYKLSLLNVEEQTWGTPISEALRRHELKDNDLKDNSKSLQTTNLSGGTGFNEKSQSPIQIPLLPAQDMDEICKGALQRVQQINGSLIKGLTWPSIMFSVPLGTNRHHKHQVRAHGDALYNTYLDLSKGLQELDTNNPNKSSQAAQLLRAVTSHPGWKGVTESPENQGQFALNARTLSDIEKGLWDTAWAIQNDSDNDSNSVSWRADLKESVAKAQDVTQYASNFLEW